jgi:hypothetical protein
MTVQEARSLAHTAMQEIKQKNAVSKPSSGLTGDTLNSFLVEKYLPYVQSYKRSWKSDVSMIKTHIAPNLGRLVMCKVSAFDITNFIETMKHKNLAPGTINRALVLLRYAYKLAQRWQEPGVNLNVWLSIKQLKVDNRIERYLTPEQSANLLHHVKDSLNPQLVFIVAFLIYTGARKREVLEVKWSDINLDQNYQIIAGSNEGYNEVWWFYVSNDTEGNTTVDKYVIFNYLDQVWYYGSMARTAWLDSSLQPYPLAADYNRRLLYHEKGVDDNATTATLPIDAYVQSSDFDIGDGHNFGFVWRILPDVNFNGSNVNAPSVTMTVKPRQNSGTAYGAADNPTVQSSNVYSNTQNFYNVQEFTGQVYTRIRGRQMAFRIESADVGVAWQLGAPRIDIRPDGRR